MATYKEATFADGSKQVWSQSSEGVLTPVASLPENATLARVGGKLELPYTLEAKRGFAPEQFGLGKYYHPNYRFSIDFNPNQLTLSQLEAQGRSMFSRFLRPIGTGEYDALPTAKRWFYHTESDLHGIYEGAKYYESTLAQLEAQYNAVIPSGQGHWTANIETSNFWHKESYGDPDLARFGYDSWSTAQNRTIVSERTGQTMTLGELWNSGQWQAEQNVRRANRLVLMLKIARARNTYASQGSSMFQGEPRTNSLSTTDVFQDGAADVSAIGGVNGVITLNGRQYTLTGTVWDAENAMVDYSYYFYFDISRTDYNEIWGGSDPAKKDYPYIWSKIKTYHVAAVEKGHWQANRHRMQSGKGALRGSVRMCIGVYEANGAGVVDGAFGSDGGEIKRPPQPELQGSISYTEGTTTYTDTPKVWMPPYLQASIYKMHRFLEGDTPGSGYHHWDSPGRAIAPASVPYYNHHLHTVTALHQARADMQPFEKYYTGSTLVADPEVQIGGTGSFSAYSGCDAFAFGPGGDRGTQKPAFAMRYKAITGGWHVVIVGGMNQPFGTSRTDVLRAPNGALNGNTFSVTTKGPSVHVFEFFVSNADTNQAYTANLGNSLDKAGYAGRIVSA